MSSEHTDLRLDARAMRILAHPLRSRLLLHLRLDGPATATELARELDTNTGASSYHLRQLAEVGLVVDTKEGTGRRRLWRAATQSHSWKPSEVRGDPDSAAALDWLERYYLSVLEERYGAWLETQADWPTAWVDESGLSDTMLTLTAGQLKQLQIELVALLERYRDLGQNDDDARRVAFYTIAIPTDQQAPTAP